MQTLVNVDEVLLAKAMEATGTTDGAAAIELALRAVVGRESARRPPCVEGRVVRLMAMRRTRHDVEFDSV